MTKLALAQVEQRLAARYGPGPGRDVGLVLTVHDELVVQAPQDDAAQVAEDVADGMRVAAAEVLRDVPVAVDVAVRDRWGADP